MAAANPRQARVQSRKTRNQISATIGDPASMQGVQNALTSAAKFRIDDIEIPSNTVGAIISAVCAADNLAPELVERVRANIGRKDSAVKPQDLKIDQALVSRVEGVAVTVPGAEHLAHTNNANNVDVPAQYAAVVDAINRELGGTKTRNEGVGLYDYCTKLDGIQDMPPNERRAELGHSNLDDRAMRIRTVLAFIGRQPAVGAPFTLNTANAWLGLAGPEAVTQAEIAAAKLVRGGGAPSAFKSGDMNVPYMALLIYGVLEKMIHEGIIDDATPGQDVAEDICTEQFVRWIRKMKSLHGVVLVERDDGSYGLSTHVGSKATPSALDEYKHFTNEAIKAHFSTSPLCPTSERGLRIICAFCPAVDPHRMLTTSHHDFSGSMKELFKCLEKVAALGYFESDGTPAVLLIAKLLAGRRLILQFPGVNRLGTLDVGPNFRRYNAM